MESRFCLSVIVPVFNEEESLNQFHTCLCHALEKMDDYLLQIIYINDGSTDTSWEMIQRLTYPYADIERINFSRNFGKEAAMSAGLDVASGDAICILDADLQDPPELLIKMIEKIHLGYDVVNMKRRNREGESFFKQYSSNYFYRLFGWLTDYQIETESGDFRMMSRRVVDQIKQLPERNRYMKGIMSWPGYKQTTLHFDRPHRIAGETKWSLNQLIDLAFNGITSFSIKPLRLATISGIVILFFTCCFTIFIVTKQSMLNELIANHIIIILSMLLLSSIQLICTGIVGEYIGRIYNESKNRPLYCIMDRDSSSASSRVKDLSYE